MEKTEISKKNAPQPGSLVIFIYLKFQIFRTLGKNRHFVAKKSRQKLFFSVRDLGKIWKREKIGRFLGVSSRALLTTLFFWRVFRFYTRKNAQINAENDRTTRNECDFWKERVEKPLNASRNLEIFQNFNDF